MNKLKRLLVVSLMMLNMSLFIPSTFAKTTYGFSDVNRLIQRIGIDYPAGTKPMQSELRKQASYVGMTYVTYLYQNDIKNPHYLASMKLMLAQVPALGKDNPYKQYFQSKNCHSVVAHLEDLQLLFDYAIQRSNPPKSIIQETVNKVKGVLSGA